MADLLVNLYDMGMQGSWRDAQKDGVRILRALSPDKGKILEFVGTHYEDGWVNECAHAFTHTPITCFVAVKDKEILGFSCYDATAKGYFGPIGMHTQKKGVGLGRALLYRTLEAMREDGYGYAVIGWTGDAQGFYENTLKVFEIPDSEPANTLYQTLSFME